MVLKIIKLTTKLIIRLPKYAKISGGWGAMLKEALRVVQQEEWRGFFIRIGRLIESPQKHSFLTANTVALDLTHLNRSDATSKLGELVFPVCDTPRVSIIIAVHNAFALTVECLVAISRHRPLTTFELFLVDDASTDPDIKRIDNIPGIRVLRNTENLGYILSCNNAIKFARGEYIHLLNNDTQVQEGWLDALLKWLDNHPEVAIAGSQLLFPDGRLQEAGAQLIRPINNEPAVLVGELIGVGASPTDPRYQYPREVDYCSGASLLVRRSLLENTGGLNLQYSPAYFEDADLAFVARKLGFRVMYVPDSKVVHHLSATLGAEGSGNKLSLIRKNATTFIQKWGNEIQKRQAIRAIAFYLPQYHPIPENDEWWGAGFTEWTNVKKARQNFPGHNQPHIPTELGYYDLRQAETHEEQAKLAQEHGISGFCYYYYWFNGKRLLEKPLNDILLSGRPDFPFCICWANENWTRTWDGKENEVLIAQSHSPEDDEAFIDSLLPYLQDPRYIRINGRALVLLYKPKLLPNPANTARIWRQRCLNAGIELYLACVHTEGAPEQNIDPRQIDFDAAVEFPPLGHGVSMKPPTPLINADFIGNCYDYQATASRLSLASTPPYTFFRGVMPAWDNTARRQDTGSIFLGSGPEPYREWLNAATNWTAKQHTGEERLIFINAWNEWGEGNHLEPDLRYGRAYLEATWDVLRQFRPLFPE